MKPCLNVYYSHYPAALHKYESMRKTRSKPPMGLPIPNLIPYAKLTAEMKLIDIGEVKSINPSLTTTTKDYLQYLVVCTGIW